MAGKLKTLVEKAGRMAQYWQECQRVCWDDPAREWSEPEYEERKQIFLGVIGQMEVELAKRSQRMEDYGWTLASDCQWHRIDESAPSPILSLTRIMAEVEKEGLAGREEVPGADQLPLMAVEGVDPAALSPWDISPGKTISGEV